MLAAFCENMIDAHHVLAGSCVRDQRERLGGGGGVAGEVKKTLVTKLAPLLEFL